MTDNLAWATEVARQLTGPAMHNEMHELGSSKLPILADGKYYRICSENECQKALMLEAQQHGSIVAYKGDVTAIMPELLNGWEQVRGGIKS